MPRKALTQLEIDDFRTAYCETAFKLYQQEDYDGVTMRGIAKAMGSSPMMAYRYFENKEDVFASLRAMQFHRLAEALEVVPRDLSPPEYLRALGEAYAGFAHAEPHAYRLLYVVHIHQVQSCPEMERAQKRTQRILFNATLRAVESGDIQGESSLLAHTFWASIHGLVSLDLAGQLTQGASFDELFPAMLDNMLAGSLASPIKQESRN